MAREGRKPTSSPEDQGYLEQREEVPYQPFEEKAAPALAPKAPAMAEEAKAEEALDNTGKILQDVMRVGLDTVKGRL